MSQSYNTPTAASSGRCIADLRLFDTDNKDKWEEMYQYMFGAKYKKNTRNFSREIVGKKWEGKDNPPIYLIPRERGGPSYKSNKLQGVNPNDVQYAPISKGYPMQDVSSFTLGPIVGEGLCLVNSAFSKCICIMHLEGGGVVNLKRKNFWQRSKKPERNIQLTTDPNYIMVDGKFYITNVWLKINEHLWFEQWNLWRKCIALCSEGDFHWTDLKMGNVNVEQTVAYRYKDSYIDFVTWKRECYIRPSYNLMPSTEVYKFLEFVWKEKRVPLGLVHPKAMGAEEVPITKEFLKTLFESKTVMCCQPFVVAGKLLGVELPPENSGEKKTVKFTIV